jgi:hypothetical protein
VVYFFRLVNGKIFFDRAIIFATFIKSITRIKWRRIMKKTDSMLSFLNAEVNVNIDFTANVNLGKRGGGGAVM